MHSGEPPHNEQAAQTCLVTGATGFIGRHLVQRLLDDSWHVRALGRSRNDGAFAQQVKWITADVSDLGALVDATSGVDVVFHLAGVGSPSSPFEDVSKLFQVNVAGTLNVLEAARQCGVKQLISASSAAVYGAIDSPAINEDAPLKPVTPYGLSKLAQEQACDMYSRQHGLNTLSLRLFNVFGPGEDMSDRNRKLIPSIVRKVRSGEPVTIYGDGSQTRDFIHVHDVVSALIYASVIRHNTPRVINIGSGVGTTVRQVAEKVSTILGVKSVFDLKPARHGEVVNSVADIQHAGETLGWKPSHSFSDGVNAMFNDTENQHEMRL